MKKLLILLLFIIVLFTGCKENEQNITPETELKLEDKTYTYSGQSYNLEVIGLSSDMEVTYHNNNQKDSGKYEVVATIKKNEETITILKAYLTILKKDPVFNLPSDIITNEFILDETKIETDGALSVKYYDQDNNEVDYKNLKASKYQVKIKALEGKNYKEKEYLINLQITSKEEGGMIELPWV